MTTQVERAEAAAKLSALVIEAASKEIVRLKSEAQFLKSVRAMRFPSEKGSLAKTAAKFLIEDLEKIQLT